MMRATAGSMRGGAVCFTRSTRESSDCRHTGLPKCWRPGRNGSDVRVGVCGLVDSERLVCCVPWHTLCLTWNELVDALCNDNS